MTRAGAAADALGSVGAEGFDPGQAEPILAAWARGELTDAQLEQLPAVCCTSAS
ncbi:MAG: antitoxin VbhA family protein [Solirubrobacteraceae bacterium]